MPDKITVWQACLLNGFLCHDRSAIYWCLVKPKSCRHDVTLSSKARDTNKHERTSVRVFYLTAADVAAANHQNYLF